MGYKAKISAKERLHNSTLTCYTRKNHPSVVSRSTTHMRPEVWNPPIALSLSEQKVAKKIKKAKLFLILREIRHELFDEQYHA